MHEAQVKRVCSPQRDARDATVSHGPLMVSRPHSSTAQPSTSTFPIHHQIAGLRRSPRPMYNTRSQTSHMLVYIELATGNIVYRVPYGSPISPIMTKDGGTHHKIARSPRRLVTIRSRAPSRRAARQNAALLLRPGLSPTTHLQYAGAHRW